MQINYGGSVAISTVDWAGKSAIVLFFRGCPLRCPYCHNYTLWGGYNFVDIEYIKVMINNSLPFVSAVVISGGEPLAHKGIFEVAAFAKSKRLLVGIETSGYYPDIAERLIQKKLVDKFFVDIKATPEMYESITKNEYAFLKLEKFLEIVKSFNVSIEFRTTIIKGLIGNTQEVREIALLVSSRFGEDITLVIQQGLPEKGCVKITSGFSAYTRGEIFNIAESVKGIVVDLKIRTIENGEEKV